MHQGEDVLSYTSSDDLVQYTSIDADSSPSRCISRSSGISGTQSNNWAWLTKFRMWLPAYLDGVYKRLKDGEVYPLSALKGDFRANCGLDMDHSSLGYSKLSEFIKSVPELCRMKIATVGNGPATHSVLLPAAAHRRMILPSNHGQVQHANETSPLAARTFGGHFKAPMAPISSIKRPGTGTLIESDSVSANQKVYQDDHDDIDVAYLYCLLCSKWHTETYWVGVPHSRFGICSTCKDDVGAYDKWKHNDEKLAQQQSQTQSLQLHGENISLAAETLTADLDTIALKSENLVAHDKYHPFLKELQSTHLHMVS